MKAERILPDKALDQHLILLGKTRSGKSSAARLLVEGLLDDGKPVCIIDPKGDWWGIKSSADGKRPGFPVVIFGGEHADIPLNEHAGAHVAELIATANRPALIDLGGWMVGERTRFFIQFASTLFRLTKGARWLVIDECHNFAPQGRIMDPDSGKMLHWANRLASEGSGKGLTLISASQRPQKVHKDYVTSHETLVAMRAIHPLDRRAVEDWIDGCPDQEKGKEVLRSLASLKRGEAWVWSPEIGFGPDRVQFPLFRTYDSFKAQLDETTKSLVGWASVNLDEVKDKLASVVQEAKANDPAELKKRISELERQLKSGGSHGAEVDPMAIDAAVCSERDRILTRGDEAWRRLDIALSSANDILLAQIGEVRSALGYVPTHTNTTSRSNKPSTGVSVQEVFRSVRLIESRPTKTPDGGTVVLSKMQRAFLTVLAQSVKPLSKRDILWHAQYQSNGQTSACFKMLEDSAWMSCGDEPGAYVITEAGREALGDFTPLPRGDALREHILASPEHSAMEKAFLRALCGSYPKPMTKAEVLELAGYKSNGQTSGAFRRIAMRGWIVDNGRTVHASDLLFGR